MKISMKVKYSIIPFIPAALAMLALRLMSIFGVDESGNFMGMDKMTISYIVIGIAVVLFIACVVINILDRKTAPVYPVKKNPVAGVLAILSGVTVIAGAVTPVMEPGALQSEYFAVNIVSLIFSIPAAIAFMLMSSIHFKGRTTISNLSLFYIFPALWGCTELVFEFLNATKVSISSSDLTSLFCYIFLTLYFFSHAMVVSRIKGRNPVKACFIYGLPGVALMLSHGVYSLITNVQENVGVISMFSSVSLIVLALYALSFIVEMFTNSYTKDELEIIDGLPKDGEDDQFTTNGYGELVKADDNDDDKAPENRRVSEYYESAKDIDDFIIGYHNDADEKEPIPYMTKNEVGKTAEGVIIPGINADMSEDAPYEQVQRSSKAVESSDSKTDASDDKIVEIEVEKPKEKSKPVIPVRAVETTEAAESPRFTVPDEEEKISDAPAAESEPVEKAEPAPKVKPAKKHEPELSDIDKQLSDIDKLLQELNNK